MHDKSKLVDEDGVYEVEEQWINGCVMKKSEQMDNVRCMKTVVHNSKQEVAKRKYIGINWGRRQRWIQMYDAVDAALQSS